MSCHVDCDLRRVLVAAINDAREQTDALRPPVACRHQLGSLPCTNDQPHPGGGRGCTHVASGHPDDRTRRDARQPA